ncbi:hypothetical protein LIER_26209 [Lithospermum erythrorhizon]|uniref:GAG-pre-integrase domain-containing protein n=1 Tax=Lithospermum erythrorhizon TaxID=34254 RepID=A0AAV3RBI8_LITER
MMATFLDCQDILGIVDGTIPQPAPNHPQYKVWIRCDRLAHSLINSSLTPAVLETLLNYDCSSAIYARIQLEKLFQIHILPFSQVINATTPWPSCASLCPSLFREDERVMVAAKNSAVLNLCFCTPILMVCLLNLLIILRRVHTIEEKNGCNALVTFYHTKTILLHFTQKIIIISLLGHINLSPLVVQDILVHLLRVTSSYVQYVTRGMTRLLIATTDLIMPIPPPSCNSHRLQCKYMEMSPPGTLTMDQQTMKTLYHINSNGSLYPFRVSNVQALSRKSISAAISSQVWHKRLGHPSVDVLISLANKKLIQCKSMTDSHCNLCQLGKHVKLPFHSAITKAFVPFQLIYSDVWEEPTLTFSGLNYYVILLMLTQDILGLIPTKRNRKHSQFLLNFTS